MPVFEYKVIPAPKRGLKAKGVKGSEAQFAHALATAMNELGADGWDYVRADTLPCEERQGLTGRTTVFQNMLVFRRSILTEEELAAQEAAALAVAEDTPEEIFEESPEPQADHADDDLPEEDIIPEAEPVPLASEPPSSDQRHAAE